jgi:hypothetical protein
MLFLESIYLNFSVDVSGRAQLLQQLSDRNFVPLIRSARQQCYATLLPGSDRLLSFETTLTASIESDTNEPFFKGDIFSFEDYVHFLIFEDKQIRAGIVFEANTSEPFRKLDLFAKTVRDILLFETRQLDADFPQWHSGTLVVPQGFRNFVARQDVDSLYTSLRKETMSNRIVAASKLEDSRAREFLRTARDAHLEGYSAKLLKGDTSNLGIEKLEDVGLVEREVQVSCRKTGHSLFRLPNAQALVVVTISDATCAECGAPVADESVAEVFAPTKLASSLLEDGSWLISRLHFLLRELGVPEREIALGPSEGNGYGQMMANICGEPFLLVTRDGDLTPAFARWAIDLEIETKACHLVIAATGRAHNEAGLLLQNHARRRISSGQDFEMILVNDVATAAVELERALERVSQRVLADELCVLDNCFGLKVSQLVLTKFQFRTREKEDAIEESSVEEQNVYSTPEFPLARAANASGALEMVRPGSSVFSAYEKEMELLAEGMEPEASISEPDYSPQVDSKFD